MLLIDDAFFLIANTSIALRALLEKNKKRMDFPEDVNRELLKCLVPGRVLARRQQFRDLVRFSLVSKWSLRVVNDDILGKWIVEVEPDVSHWLPDEILFSIRGQLKLPTKVKSSDCVHFPNLTSLVLVQDVQKCVVTEIGRLTNLKHLTILCNSIVKDEHLYNLTQLEYLLLLCGSDGINGDIFTRLRSLTSLDLTTNKIITDEKLIKLTNLVRLTLCCKSIITDNSLTHLTALQYLNLRDNASISDGGLEKMTSLTELSLLDNRGITTAFLFRLVNLKILTLDDSYYGNTKYFSRLTCLESLTLYEVFVPWGVLGNLTTLTNLQLHHYNEHHIGKFDRLTNLRSLCLDIDRKVKYLDLGNLIGLTSLDIRCTCLEIGDEIRKFSRLEVLMGNAHIHYETYQYLPNLTTLSVENDITGKLTESPLTRLQDLTILCAELPEYATFKGLKLLKKLYLKPLVSPTEQNVKKFYMECSRHYIELRIL